MPVAFETLCQKTLLHSQLHSCWYHCLRTLLCGKLQTMCKPKHSMYILLHIKSKNDLTKCDTRSDTEVPSHKTDLGPEGQK